MDVHGCSAATSHSMKEGNSKSNSATISDAKNSSQLQSNTSEHCRTESVAPDRTNDPSDGAMNVNNVSRESNVIDLKSKTNGEDSVSKHLPKCVEEPVDDKHNAVTALTKEEFMILSPEQMWEHCQQLYIAAQKLQAKLSIKNAPSSSTDADEGDLREAAERLKSQLAEAQRKEAYHIMRLSTKEHELQEMAGSVASSKSYSIARGSLLDPAVNLCIERLKRDLEAARSKTEEAQNELAAWKFTPDSNTGKQLMAKCRLLIKENEELGRAISSGKVAKLEGDITMQRECTEELKKSQSELDEFLMEVEEETEGMQGTILYLQQQLRSTKQQLQQLQAAQTTSINNNSTCNSPVVALSATPPMQHPAASSSATPLSPQRVATSSNTAASSASVMNETPAAVAELSANMNLESKVPMSPIKETLDPEIIPDIMESYTEIPTSRESAVKTSLHEDLVKKESSVKVECLIPSDARVPSPEKRGLDDVLSDVESMIIPHDEVLVAVDGQISNGQKRTRPNTDTESLDSTSNCEPVNEPMCKRTKITMLGDEDRSSESKPNGLPE